MIQLTKTPEMPPVQPLQPARKELPKHVMKNVQGRLPALIQNLGSINTQYASERQYIGEAISFLRLMQDMIEE